MSAIILSALLVMGAGFSSMIQESDPVSGEENDDGEAAPDPYSETIVVSTRRYATTIGETATSVTVVDSEAMSRTAAITLDDTLRRMPGFTLFQRTGSATSNPTTLGVSLRGLGGSAASRAGVYLDGVPMNDPFGGWVYWGRVARISLERMEVVRGGTSDIWGSPSLAGTVALISRRGGPVVRAEVEVGERDVSKGAISTRVSWGATRLALDAESFRTGGYIRTSEQDRGAIDRPVSSEYASSRFGLERLATESRFRTFFRVGVYDEKRGNGSPLQVNDTRIMDFSAGLDTRFVSSIAEFRLWGGDQRFRQVFSAVASDRESERVVRRQSVPSSFYGATGVWRRVVDAGATSHLVSAGVEGRWVTGRSDELISFTNARVAAGGKQTTLGVWIQDDVSLSDATKLHCGARLDSWKNSEAFSGSVTEPVGLGDRSETHVSPRVSVIHRANPSISFAGSVYQSFRAPTLNELYRSFRVGSVTTRSNENLSAELVTGTEAGVTFERGRVVLRGNLYWMEMNDSIANVTIGENLRQRQNIGRTISQGVEIDVRGRTRRGSGFSIGYQYTDATIRSFPAEPGIEGNRVPQVPKHQWTAQLDHPWGRTISGAQIRWSSPQFEDDRNELELDGFAIVDLFLSARLDRQFTAFLSIENLLDAEVEVGRTPNLTIGPPRAVRLGIRAEVGSR